MKHAELTILKILDQTPHGWVGRDRLGVPRTTMCELFIAGYVESSALPDSKGAGNFASTNLWRITPAGRKALAAVKEGGIRHA